MKLSPGAKANFLFRQSLIKFLCFFQPFFVFAFLELSYVIPRYSLSTWDRKQLRERDTSSWISVSKIIVFSRRRAKKRPKHLLLTTYTWSVVVVLLLLKLREDKSPKKRSDVFLRLLLPSANLRWIRGRIVVRRPWRISGYCWDTLTQFIIKATIVYITEHNTAAVVVVALFYSLWLSLRWNRREKKNTNSILFNPESATVLKRASLLTLFWVCQLFKTSPIVLNSKMILFFKSVETKCITN